MNERLLQLAARQGLLKARIEAQRLSLAEQTEPLETALARGDTVLQGVDWKSKANDTKTQPSGQPFQLNS